MKLGTMLGEIIRSLVARPATRTRPVAPPTLRGPLVWDRERCTGCGLCVMDCPARAIEITTLDKASKRFVFTNHLDRCTFCAQCVWSCRQGALHLSSTPWELASDQKGSFIHHYGEPDDVATVLAQKPTPGARVRGAA